MLKPFTKEGRFECGLEGALSGKLWAFVAIVGDPYRLGVAVANESGYIPIPATWCCGDDYAEMDLHASELNIAEGLTAEMQVRIVASSMAAGKVRHSTADQLFENRWTACQQWKDNPKIPSCRG